MYSKEQQLRRGTSGSSNSATSRQHEEEHSGEDEQSWDLEIVTTPRSRANGRARASTPPKPRKPQVYKPADPGRKHYLVRNMKRETYDKLHTLATTRFDQRDVNWLINHILDAYE